MSSQEYFFANRPVEYKGVNPKDDIKDARDRGYPLPSDPNQAVKRTLQTHGMSIHPSPIPDADRYISSRINNFDDKFPGFNYGTFVQTSEKNIAFAKVRYGPHNTEKKDVDGELVDKPVGGLKREAQVLSALSEYGFRVPAVFGYFPATPEDQDPEPDQAETLETLTIEAIPPHEGSTLPPKLWTPEIARNAAGIIKTFEKPVAEISFFQEDEKRLPLDILVRRSRLDGKDSYGSTINNIIASNEHLEEPIVVHGDAWLSNYIIYHKSNDVFMVDWELAGPGYKGQDAGCTLWGLTLDEQMNFSGVNESARAFIDEWCQTEDDRRSLRFGVMFESLRWIADRQDRLHTETLDDAGKQNLNAQIEAAKIHALKIIGNIPASVSMQHTIWQSSET